MLNLLPTTLRFLLGSLLWLDFSQPPLPPVVLPARTPLSFQLRHEHAITNDSRVIFSNVAPSFAADSYVMSTSNIQTHRPQSAKVLWDTTNVLGPNVEERETLLTLAKMTSNAYTSPTASDWYTQDGWNNSTPFGWEPDADGIRGHIFVSD
ncbi:hypothetical protein EDD22DRAFT_191807 [Suillus occidentalis]|nr:hypothetical protein EDD22DRAFT_191807 [Suillus occidentalis]